jgi:voltage-gated sodium channel
MVLNHSKQVLLIFTAECILRILEQQLSPWKYFYSVWNCFDFIIVGACWIPGADSPGRVCH